MLVYVRIYYPFSQRAKNISLNSIVRLNNVTAVLGSQTLADLRDKISCIADYSISRECSEKLDNAIGPMAKVIL